MKFAVCFAGLAVVTNAYQLGAAPRLAARRRSALVVLQEQPERDANENATERWGTVNLMDMMDTAESEAAPEAAARPEGAAAQPAAPPVEESSYLASEKARYGVSDAVASDDGGGGLC
jgi:hypothetical protein